MSLDKSLKAKNALARHRNVLTRAERVQKMIDEEAWPEGGSVLGLAKTRVYRAVSRKAKAKAEAKEAEAAAEEAAAEEGATEEGQDQAGAGND